MATEPIFIAGASPATANHGPTSATSLTGAISDYLALTKPEVNFLIGLATCTGFYLGHATQSERFPFLLLINTLLGTLLVASGTGTLNQYIERSFDAKMRRQRAQKHRHNHDAGADTEFCFQFHAAPSELVSEGYRLKRKQGLVRRQHRSGDFIEG